MSRYGSVLPPLRSIGVACAAVIIVLAGGGACAESRTADSVQPLAEAFVALTLQLGRVPGHDEEVDSYFGPLSLHPPARDPPMSLGALSAAAHALLQRIVHEQHVAPTARGDRLLVQTRSLAALIDLLEQPHRWTFEQEASRIYGMAMPVIDPLATRRTLSALDAALPGRGDLSERLEDFRSRFVVPPERRKVVFDRALEACRRRTLAHWKLPAGERLEVEWTDSVGAAWHRYRGGGRSTLEINPQAVALIGSVIDVACHEAYPGHHVQFLLLQQHAGAAGLPVEDTVVLLRSPASVLREGAANFGIELVFPFKERVAFDRRVLFPLAGLDPAQAEHYETVHRLVDRLSSSAAPILAAYQDGRLSFGVAAAELETDALIASPAALLRFVDQYGAYALGYTAARDRVRDYVEAQSACAGADPWSVLKQVVSEPRISVLSTGNVRCADRAKPRSDRNPMSDES